MNAIELFAGDVPARGRFTIAHELGRWISQCLEGTVKPVYCRAEEIGVDPEAKRLNGKRTPTPPILSCRSPRFGWHTQQGNPIAPE